MFVTNWISTTKIQKISEITNFFRHYFLSRTEVFLVLYLHGSGKILLRHEPGCGKITLFLVMRYSDFNIVRSILLALVSVHFCFECNHYFCFCGIFVELRTAKIIIFC